jgi:hypothetical protein
MPPEWMLLPWFDSLAIAGYGSRITALSERLSDSHLQRDSVTKSLLLILGITLLAVLVHGYHLGVEDQGVYLPGIKKLLDPALYPYDADFFLVQLQATLFDELIAGSVRLTRLPLDWTLFLWHLASIFLLLLGCRAISRRCFREPAAQWAAVGTVAALLTLPVAGTALYLVDQYLHPRTLATAPILFAIVDTLERRWTRVALWLTLAGLMHPLMAAFGASFVVFLSWRAAPPRPAVLGTLLLLPFGLLQSGPAWREATLSRPYFFLLRWEWYEWLGILAPLGLLWWYRKLAARYQQPVLKHLSERLALFGLFHFAVAAAITIPGQFIALVPLQPMRFLHLLYILFFLFSGGLIGQWLLRERPLRWLLLFLPLCAVMFYAQRRLFPASPHVEWPGAAPQNRWVEAFDWARQNTPRNALFALDPRYLERPGEDNHGFRALAERSALADGIKDEVVAAVSPQLAYAWQQQAHALSGWRDFRPEDFSRLHRHFGVAWVVVEEPGAGLACPYRRAGILVCPLE